MMITLQDLFAFLQNLLSPDELTDYCPNGIQVEGKQKVKHICFSVSTSVAVLEEARKKGADALIVHHGLFWNKDSLPIVGVKRKKLEILLKNEISLLAYHLPLDVHKRLGNNWKAASDLGLKELKPFFPLGKTHLGVKGTFRPMHVDDFRKQLESYYGHPAHVALGGKKEVSSAAIISGGAHRYLDSAADEGVDCYITGSFDEPVWDIAHERNIHFFALGHYATERVAMLALMAEVQKELKASCEFIDLFNPF